MPASLPETRASLILRLQDADDVVAWDEFVDIYAPAIFRAATRRGLQAADADNLIQEVLLAVSQSVTRWLERDDRGSFRAWLLRIARNETVNMLTRRATRSLGADGEQAQQEVNSLADNGEITSIIEHEYERAVFQWAADKVRQSVAHHTWQAFWLTHVEGHSIEHAAKLLNTRPGNIYFGRSRVMTRIRSLVQQYEEDND